MADEKSAFINLNLAGATFRDVSLRDARFTDINLAGSRFDDINFSDAEITGNCNFAGMRIDGVPVADLFAAWKKQQGLG